MTSFRIIEVFADNQSCDNGGLTLPAWQSPWGKGREVNTSSSCSLVAAVTREGRHPAVSPACLGCLRPKGKQREKPRLRLHPAFSLSLWSLKERAKPCCCQISHLHLVGGTWWEGRRRSPEETGVCRARPGGGSRMGAVAPSCSTRRWQELHLPRQGAGAVPALPVVVWLQTDIYSKIQPNRTWVQCLPVAVSFAMSRYFGKPSKGGRGYL